MAKRVGRPKNELARAEHLVTRRVRALMHLVHEGNLGEASRIAGIPYPTMRDLYTGRTVNPSLRTLEALADCYRIPLEWFTEEEEPEEVPAEGLVGFLPPHPSEARGRPHLREVLIPFAAWPMYRAFTLLEARLAGASPSPDRPIVGEATGDAFRFRLTTFLFQPLLAAERAGEARAVLPGPAAEASPEVMEGWVEKLTVLGRTWSAVLPGLMGSA